METEVKTYIEQLRGDFPPEMRRAAAENLAEHLKSPSSCVEALCEDIVVSLCDGLRDPDKGVRDMCAIAILKDTNEFPHLKSRSIVPLISHSDIAIRNLAADVLQRLGSPSALALLAILPFGNIDEQKLALDIIGLTGEAIQHAPYITSLLDAENDNVRSSAIEALGNLRDASVVPRLLAMYNTDPEMQPYIIDALGNIGGEMSVAFLAGIVKEANDEFLQIAAVEALAHCAETGQIANDLLNSMSNVPSSVQPVLLKAAVGIAFRSGIELTAVGAVREVAHRALYDDDEDTIIAGLLALGSSYSIADAIPIADALFHLPTAILEHAIISLAASPVEVAARVFHIIVRSESVAHDTWYADFLGVLASVLPFIKPGHLNTMLLALVYNFKQQPQEQQREFIYFLRSLDPEHIKITIATDGNIPDGISPEDIDAVRNSYADMRL